MCWPRRDSSHVLAEDLDHGHIDQDDDEDHAYIGYDACIISFPLHVIEMTWLDPPQGTSHPL